jgi:ubiquinone/menaquinone biosynthesis C-methylase UbiE
MNNRSPGDLYPAYFRYLFWPLRVFFYLLYHQLAWTYDWVAAVVSIGAWQNWVLSVLPYLEEGRCLELGHGPGHLQQALWDKKDASLAVFGLDASPQMGRIANRRLKRSGVSPNLVNGFAQNLPFPEGTYRCVVATFPTEYIFNPSTLAEIHRVLAPGGRLVVLTSAFITGQRQREKTAAWLFKVTGQSSPLDRRLLEPARQAGFRVRVEEIKLNTSVVILCIAEKGEPF